MKFKITDIRYEYPFYKMSSSKRDADQNSEYDQNRSHYTGNSVMNNLSLCWERLKLSCLYGVERQKQVER